MKHKCPLLTKVSYIMPGTLLREMTLRDRINISLWLECTHTPLYDIVCFVCHYPQSDLLTFETFHVADSPPLTLSVIGDFYVKQIIDVKFLLFSIFHRKLSNFIQKTPTNLYFYVGDSKFFIDFVRVSPRMWESQ